MCKRCHENQSTAVVNERQEFFRCLVCGGVGNWGEGGICALCLKTAEDQGNGK